jgi:acyl-CoA thioester hydrolase
VPITYPATVEVQLLAGTPGRSSVPTYYRMYCVGKETLYAEGEAKVIWISGATGKSVPLPDHIRARLVP